MFFEIDDPSSRDAVRAFEDDVHELFEDSVQDLDLELVGSLKNFDFLAADENKAEISTAGALSGSNGAYSSAGGSSTAMTVSLVVVCLVAATIGVAYYIGRRDGRFTRKPDTPEYHEADTKDDLVVTAFPLSNHNIEIVDSNDACSIIPECFHDDENASIAKRGGLKNKKFFDSCMKNLWPDW